MADEPKPEHDSGKILAAGERLLPYSSQGQMAADDLYGSQLHPAAEADIRIDSVPESAVNKRISPATCDRLKELAKNERLPAARFTRS